MLSYLFVLLGGRDVYGDDDDVSEAVTAESEPVATTR